MRLRRNAVRKGSAFREGCGTCPEAMPHVDIRGEASDITDLSPGEASLTALVEASLKKSS